MTDLQTLFDAALDVMHNGHQGGLHCDSCAVGQLFKKGLISYETKTEVLQTTLLGLFLLNNSEKFQNVIVLLKEIEIIYENWISEVTTKDGNFADRAKTIKQVIPNYKQRLTELAKVYGLSTQKLQLEDVKFETNEVVNV